MIARRVAAVALLALLAGCATQEELTIETVASGDFRLTVGVRHLVCDSEPILQAREVDGAIELRARRATNRCGTEQRLTEFELDFSEPLPGRQIIITQPAGVTVCPVAELVTVTCN